MGYGRWPAALAGGAFALGVLLTLFCSFQAALVIAGFLLLYLCWSIFRW